MLKMYAILAPNSYGLDTISTQEVLMDQGSGPCKQRWQATPVASIRTHPATGVMQE